MSYAAPGSHRYLDARITTASQPELQLMLLDGALRFVRQARQMWVQGPNQRDSDGMIRRTLDIVEELIRSVSAGQVEQSKRLEEEYAFVFRQLTAAHINQDLQALDSATSLLAFQRETWRLVCEGLKPHGQTPTPAFQTALMARSVSGLPHPAAEAAGSGSLSLEA